MLNCAPATSIMNFWGIFSYFFNFVSSCFRKLTKEMLVFNQNPPTQQKDYPMLMLHLLLWDCLGEQISHFSYLGNLLSFIRKIYGRGYKLSTKIPKTSLHEKKCTHVEDVHLLLLNCLKICFSFLQTCELSVFLTKFM